jgi:hypothetical protein
MAPNVGREKPHDSDAAADLTTDSTTSAKMTKFGRPLRFIWSNFERVEAYWSS